MRSGTVILIRYQLKASFRPSGVYPKSWDYDFPFGVVEIDAACVRCKVVGFIWRSGRLTISACGFEIDLNDLRVAVTPLAFDKLRTFFGGKVDRRLRFALGEEFIGRRRGDKPSRRVRRAVMARRTVPRLVSEEIERRRCRQAQHERGFVHELLFVPFALNLSKGGLNVFQWISHDYPQSAALTLTT